MPACNFRHKTLIPNGMVYKNKTKKYLSLENIFDIFLISTNKFSWTYTGNKMNDSSLYKSHKITLHKDIFMRNHVNELVNAVKEDIENGYTSIAIDFNEVANIDIIGFGILRTVQKISITNNVNIKLINVQDNVKKILENSWLILDIQTRREEESFIHEEIALIA